MVNILQRSPITLTAYCKFPVVCVCRKLCKLIESIQSYCNNSKGSFLEHGVDTAS